MKFIFMIICILPALVFGLEGNELTILFTNNINGNFENCLCDEHPLGSLEKMKTVVDSIRENSENVILLDAGDFASPFGDSLKDNYVYQIGKLMKYDAMAVGDQEFSNGVDFFLEHQKINQLPYVSANLRVGKNEKFPAFIYKNFDEIRVLVISAIFPDVFKFYEPGKIAGVELDDPVGSLQDIIKKNPAELVIILSHNGLDNDKLLANELPGAHFILSAHTQDFLEKPLSIQGINIIQAGSDGFYLGKIDIRFSKKQIESFHYQAIPMTLNLHNDSEIVRLIGKYHFEKNKQVLSKGGYPEPVPPLFMVASPESCGDCHGKELEHWRKSAHAQAYTTIEKKGKTKLLKCLSCHVSGIGREEGFVNLNITPTLASVTCTECHYTERMHLSDPDKNKPLKIEPMNCLRCHDSDNDPEFDFKKALDKALHRIN